MEKEWIKTTQGRQPETCRHGKFRKKIMFGIAGLAGAGMLLLSLIHI